MTTTTTKRRPSPLRGLVAALIVLMFFPAPRHMILSFAANTVLIIIFGILGVLFGGFVLLMAGQRR